VQLLTRLNLRQNWPLVVAVTTCLILYLLFSISTSQATSPYYHYQIGDKVEYSALFSLYNKRTVDYPAFLVITTVIAALISLLGLLRSPRYKALLSIFFVILTLWWAGKICGDTLPRGGSILKNIQSITFNQSGYRLTLLSNLPVDLDWVEQFFLVYKCEINSDKCTLFQSFQDEKYQFPGKSSEASLIADPNTSALYLQINDDKTLIAR
jgi:hypothetical protein